MRGNSFGHLFTVTSFGESHGKALGVVIDGIPAGLSVELEDLSFELERRRPGRLNVSTSRQEQDSPQILSGVFENKTLGTPICVIIENQNQRSQDYDKLREIYRPGHADQTTIQKYGIRDHRGGGRASGRETVSRVIAGYFASLIIPNIKFTAVIKSLGPFKAESKDLRLPPKNKLGFATDKFAKEIENYLVDLKSSGDSVGGSVFLSITHCPPGLGDPVFEKLKAQLSKAMLSIGSCMGIQFGLGHEFTTALGSEISAHSHNFAGIEGGISNGEEIYLELTFKAPSTIGENAKDGRHDPCILPRVLPVVESMAKIVLADFFLRQNAYQIANGNS